MPLPNDSVAANTLPEVTTIPTGKKLIFTDPDTNEGGIITLENLTKQILQNLTSQTFSLDQGTKTLVQALNELNSNTRFDVTAPNNVSIINNASIKVGRVVYIAVKLKIVGALSSETILSFLSNATNSSTTFSIGKGTEWDISSVVYGYIGGNSIVINGKNAVSTGDYLHVSTVLIL